jgi:hypothetical protein
MANVFWSRWHGVRVVALLGAGAVLFAIGSSGAPRPASSSAHQVKAVSAAVGRLSTTAAGARPMHVARVGRSETTLPRIGTRTWFPAGRLVAFYGTPGTARLGILGATDPEQAANQLEQVASAYRTPGRTVIPTFELIATVADPAPGPDGSYSHTVSTADVWRYLAVAREHHMAMILDVQPGRQDFLPQVQHWTALLSQPDVGLALDSEWRMHGDEVPGQVIGHTDAAEINTVTEWLAQLVRHDHLPQKIVLLHQFKQSMITDPQAVAAHPEIALVQHLDGFGSRATKLAIYASLCRPAEFHMGFKLFYRQDLAMLSPAGVLAISPTPDYVSYQ